MIESHETLYDTSKPGTIDMVILLAGMHDPPAAHGLLDLPVPDTDTFDPVNQWMREEEANLRQLARERWTELGGKPEDAAVAVEAVRSRESAQARLDQLRRDHYVVELQRPYGDDDDSPWSALLVKREFPREAALGDLTKQATIRFSPRMTDQGSVVLHASAEVALAPGVAPAGVDGKAWFREATRLKRLMTIQANWMVARLNLLRIPLPENAEQLLSRGHPVTLRRQVPFWGEKRDLQLELSGHVIAQIDIVPKQSEADVSTHEAGNIRPLEALKGWWRGWNERRPPVLVLCRVSPGSCAPRDRIGERRTGRPLDRRRQVAFHCRGSRVA